MHFWCSFCICYCSFAFCACSSIRFQNHFAISVFLYPHKYINLSICHLDSLEFVMIFFSTINKEPNISIANTFHLTVLWWAAKQNCVIHLKTKRLWDFSRPRSCQSFSGGIVCKYSHSFIDLLTFFHHKTSKPSHHPYLPFTLFLSADQCCLICTFSSDLCPKYLPPSASPANS